MKQSTDYASHPIHHLPKRSAFYIGATAAIVFALLGIAAILRSTSSTAVIGFFYLPFEAIIIFLLFYFIGYWVGTLIQGLLDHHYRYRPRFLLALIITIPTIIFFVTLFSEIGVTYRDVNRISHMNSQQLDETFLKRPKKSLYGYDIFILAAIAQNRNASSALLDKIAHLEDPRINDRLGSIVNLTNGNTKGLAVIRLVVRNPNTDTQTLVYLTKSSNYELLSDLATNPKLPVDVLRKLYDIAQQNDAGYWIEWGLAYNPNTPADILRAVAKKIKYDRLFDPIKSALQNNPSTPEDVKKILSK